MNRIISQKQLAESSAKEFMWRAVSFFATRIYSHRDEIFKLYFFSWKHSTWAKYTQVETVSQTFTLKKNIQLWSIHNQELYFVRLFLKSVRELPRCPCPVSSTTMAHRVCVVTDYFDTCLRTWWLCGHGIFVVNDDGDTPFSSSS